MDDMRIALLRYCVIALLTSSVTFGAPVPQNIKETVKKIQTTNGFEPRDLFFTMEVALPKMTGDAEQCKEMTELLKAAINAPETTAPAKTIFHQYLLKVDPQAEAQPLGEIFVKDTCEKKSEADCLALLASAQASERLAGLVAYVTGYPQKASKVCADAVKDSDWTVRATAIRRLGSLDAKTFASSLPSLAGDDRRIALDVVEKEKIIEAAGTVRDWVKAGDEQAVQALAVIGTTADVEILASAPGGEKALAQMAQTGIDAKITELLKTNSSAEAKVALLNASALRDSAALPGQLVIAIDDKEPKVRQAAFRLLGRHADAVSYSVLVAKLGGPDTEAVETATRLAIRRLGAEQKFLEPLLKRMKDTEPVQDAVLKVLSVFTDDAALAAVVQALPRDAAVRAVCSWQTNNACVALEKIKSDASYSTTHRALAERALERLGQSLTQAKAVALPEVRANAGALKKILILTGQEHHNNWKQLTPILVESFAKDKRLEVSVSEEPAIMTKAEILARYDGVVMLYNNSDKKPAPEGALANLKKAVEGGKGLVLVHFSSGAFCDWTIKKVDPAFCEIAGRVWNPACRGHDPHGTFTVNITDKAHPITKGLSDYEQTDELYTCLEGPGDIQVLASAVSKVDQKTYPLAFVLKPGKGRTFHCALGHCPKAFNEPTKQLFRQGVLWSVGLE
jgi:type 1 glutamine amidotransferase